MRRQAKPLKITRKCHTQQPQTYYPQHLILKKQNLFNNRYGNAQDMTQLKREYFCEQTNFGFSLTNEYMFVLLHLKNKDNKNVLNLNIPEVGVFVDKVPYDILYSQEGFIKGLKTQQGAKCRLKDLQLTFKEVWKNKKLSKLQHVTAVFKQKQVLVMSETDFSIACKKMKSDPFFKKLQYMQNKLAYTGQEIVTQYDSANKEEGLIKLATQSLLGFKDEQKIWEQLGEDKYLGFLNQKISLVLNYQHNIRVVKANFHYVKNEQSEYFLVNVTNLHLHNLTKALQLREEKLKKIQQARQHLLTMTPEKQRIFKSYENPQEVKKIEKVLKQNFQSIVRKMNFTSITDSKHEEIKNQLAFRRLHPEIKTNYQELLACEDFKKTRQTIFGSTIAGRKPISIPSKYILRSYNKTKRNYTLQTQQSDKSP